MCELNMGRARTFCPSRECKYRGRIVNAYVRLGAKGTWKKIGSVCVKCGFFWFDGPGD